MFIFNRDENALVNWTWCILWLWCIFAAQLHTVVTINFFILKEANRYIYLPILYRRYRYFDTQLLHSPPPAPPPRSTNLYIPSHITVSTAPPLFTVQFYQNSRYFKITPPPPFLHRSIHPPPQTRPPTLSPTLLPPPPPLLHYLIHHSFTIKAKATVSWPPLGYCCRRVEFLILFYLGTIYEK